MAFRPLTEALLSQFRDAGPPDDPELTDNLVSEPVACVCTLRSEESSPAFAVAGSLIARRAAPAIELSPLSGSEVSAMARACLDLASLPRDFDAIIQECSDGLPFLVEELLAGAAGAGVIVQADHGWRVEPGAHPELEDDWCDLAAQLAGQAGDRDRAAALLLQAGRRSLARGALATAETTLESALALAVDSRELALDVKDALCETLSSAGEVDRSLEVGSEVVAQLQSASGPTERLCQVHLRLARAAAAACRWGVAETHLARATALAGPDESLTACAEAIAAHVLMGRDDPERAAAAALSALAVAERAGLHEVAC